MADILEYLDRYSRVLESAHKVITGPEQMEPTVARNGRELLLALAQNQEHINSLILDKIEKLEQTTTQPRPPSA